MMVLAAPTVGRAAVASAPAKVNLSFGLCGTPSSKDIILVCLLGMQHPQSYKRKNLLRVTYANGKTVAYALSDLRPNQQTSVQTGGQAMEGTVMEGNGIFTRQSYVYLIFTHDSESLFALKKSLTGLLPDGTAVNVENLLPMAFQEY